METLTFPQKVNARVCILVVDDHPGTAATLARALSQLGPQVEALSATSAENALEMVREKHVDVLITDMMMVGMNGMELIDKMQSHPRGRPAYTMVITAYDVPGLKTTAQRLNVNEIVIKPIRPERVCQLVAKAIEGFQGLPNPQVSTSKEPLKILIADDMPDNVALLTRFLGNEGYNCITAADGLQALSKIRIEMPDMVLLDINMPHLDGFEVLQEIRSDPAIAHIPVIMLTAARLDVVDMHAALNMGADDYLTKPFDRRELLARIRTKLRVKEAEDIIRRRNKELNMLPEIGRELSARLDIEDLTDVVLRRSVETLGALLGHIVLLDEERPLHKTYYFARPGEKQSGMRLPPLESLTALVNENRQGFIVGDAHEDLRWPVAADDAIRSVVVVPMFGRFGLVGLLVLAHERTEYFSIEHLLLLQAIASQATIAVENAQLFTRMAQQIPQTNTENAEPEKAVNFELARQGFFQAIARLRDAISQQVEFTPEQRQFVQRVQAAIALIESPLQAQPVLKQKDPTVPVSSKGSQRIKF